MKPREIVIVENLRLVRLLDLTTDFGVLKANAKLTPILKLREKNKNVIQSCMYTVTQTPDFLRKFPDGYSLIHNFSDTNLLPKCLLFCRITILKVKRQRFIDC